MRAAEPRRVVGPVLAEHAAMTVQIGFDHYTIAHRALTPEATLAFAQEHGFDGVQFLEPASLDRALDPARLAAIRGEAEARGLYLEVGLPSPNPVRRSRQEERTV